MNIQVGPLAYTLCFTADEALDLEDDFGRCIVEQGRLLIHSRLSHSQTQETVTHECLHALLSLTGLDVDLGEKKSEDVCRRLAPALLDWLRRNPPLIDFLEISCVPAT